MQNGVLYFNMWITLYCSTITLSAVYNNRPGSLLVAFDILQLPFYKIKKFLEMDTLHD